MRGRSAGALVLAAVGLGLLLAALTVGGVAVPPLIGLVPILLAVWIVVTF